MAIYEVQRSYIESYVNEQIGQSPEFQNYKKELIDLFIYNTPEEDEAIKGNNDFFVKDNQVQLYIKDSRHHIRIKDIVVDFLENIFSGFLLQPMLFWFGLVNDNNGLGVAITVEFIFFMRRVIKEYVVKLNDIEFCLYLQIVTHLQEYNQFTWRDLAEWLPKSKGEQCNMPTTKCKCSYRMQGKCDFCKEDLSNILQKMVDKGVLEYREEVDMYRIRF